MDVETLKEFRDRMVIAWLNGAISSIYDVEKLLNHFITQDGDVPSVTGDSDWSMNQTTR